MRLVRLLIVLGLAFSCASNLLAQDSKAAIDQAEKARRDGRYALALECLRQAEAAGASAASATARQEIDSLRRKIRDEAKKALQELLEESERLEVRGKATAAIALLEKSALDFPAGRDFQPLLDRLEALRGKGSRSKAGSATGTPASLFPEQTTREMLDLYRRALEWESQGKFEESLEICRNALAKTANREIAKPFAWLAEEVQREIWCLTALADAVLEDGTRFLAMDLLPGMGKVDLLASEGKGLRLRASGSEQPFPWSKFTGEAWARLLARASFDPYDRCNAAVFLARRGATSEADRWLASALEKDPVQKNLIDGILARRCGEEIPPGGYAWHRGAWIRQRDLEEFRFSGEIEKQLALLDRAGEERGRVWESLAHLSKQAMAPLRVALAERVEKSWGELRQSGFLKAFARLEQQREELDRTRRYATELIFDEEKYFYPYREPECPPEKSKLYPAVQEEVDRRVAAVRAIWERKDSVSLSKATRAAIAWLQEIDSFAASLGMRVERDEALYDAVLAIDAEEESIGIRDFCRDARERTSRILADRRVLAFNALVMTSASEEERRQVAVTNSYRAMFGRRALALNEKLQLAARLHSKEMEEKDYFSHFSPTPELRTPFDRMKRQGYTNGAGENIASGMTDAESAHQGWIHSSGHHRNILDPSHREMGSGLSGALWTQNFGSGKEYEENPAWARN